MEQDAVAAVVVEVVRIAGVVVRDAIGHGHVFVSITLGLVIVDPIDMDAGIGVVEGAAVRNADVPEPRQALVRGPAAHGKTVLAEPAGLHVLDPDEAQALAAGQGVDDLPAAAFVAAPLLARCNYVED